MNENNNPLFENEENNKTPEFSESTEYVESESEASISPEEESADISAENTLPEPEQETYFAENAENAEVSENDAYLTDENPVADFAEPSSEENHLYNTEENAADSENSVNEDTFNPYAPKAPAADTYSANNYNTNPNYQGTPQNQVNPSYNQPLNQNYNNYNQGYNPNYTQGYNSGNYSPYQPPAPKDNKRGKVAVLAIIGICVFVGIIAIVSSLFGNSNDNYIPDTTANSTETTTDSFNSEVQPTSSSTATNSVISTTQGYDQNINSIWVAEKVRPSVVGVLAYQQGELAGEGSGVLMSEDTAKNCTYVITCAHVINEPGCEFAILLLDGRSYEAQIVALDERTDIGVLKVTATGLPLAEFGDSASLKIGEPIYAIGNPGGSEYFGSITNGIVAAIDRSINATYTMTCIQHNAAINPGNSGGALVNTAGQVIGINSSKIARTDYEGMGFAVPSAIFTSVVDALIQYGYVPNRPELGIKYASVSDYQLYSLIVSIKGLPRESIIIAEIPEGSALSGTQAQVGDLIIAVNGKKMDSSDVLLDLIDTGAVGDTLTLTLCRVQDRSYETSTFDVTVQLVEDKGSITTTTQAPTLPSQGEFGEFGGFEDFFDFFS